MAKKKNLKTLLCISKFVDEISSLLDAEDKKMQLKEAIIDAIDNCIDSTKQEGEEDAG